MQGEAEAAREVDAVRPPCVWGGGLQTTLAEADAPVEDELDTMEYWAQQALLFLIPFTHPTINLARVEMLSR